MIDSSLERELARILQEETKIGKCNNCDCGNRPGPWHNKNCPAYMPTEHFTDTKEDSNED